MTVTFKSAGTGVVFASDAASPAPNGGTPPAAGDRSIMTIAVKPETATVNTPTNWTHIETKTGGTGSFAADTGPTKVAMYYRDDAFTGGQSVTSSGVDSGAAWIITGQKTLAAWAPVVSTSGSDDVDGDNATYSAVMATDPGIEAGDWLVAGTAIPTDDSTAIGSGAITATGLSGGSTPSFLVESTTGFACALGHVRREGFTGTASTVATVGATFTGSTNTYGPCVLVRLRDLDTPPPPDTTIALVQAGATYHY